MEDNRTPRELGEAELDGVTGGKISTSTQVVKVPGPTDFIVTTATNPSGNSVPGHQSTTEVRNNQT